jgi:uncharacterized protein (TIGR02246 family)
MPSETPYSALDTPFDVPQIFCEAWNRRDADRLANLFVFDAEFVNVTGLWWHSREAIRKAHDYGLRTIFSDSTLRVVRTKIRYAGDEVAVVHAKMKLSGQSPVGGIAKPGERRTLFTFVVHWLEGQWWCIAAQNTDIIPHMDTHVRDGEGYLQAINYTEAQRGAPHPPPYEP